jgi:hypothetical protein
MIERMEFTKPKPIEKPLILPPIKKPEVEKKHIKRTGKK